MNNNKKSVYRGALKFFSSCWFIRFENYYFSLFSILKLKKNGIFTSV